MAYNPKFSSRGQSIIEVLVAISVAAIFFIGAATFIAPALTINKVTQQSQTAGALGKQLLDNVRVWSDGNWMNIFDLQTSSANTYYLITSSSPFTVTTGTESIAVSTTTITRYFYVSDVYRDMNGYVTSTSAGNTYDPSTKQVTVIYDWASENGYGLLPRGDSNITTGTLSEFITRNRSAVTQQTDWSGGPGLAGPVTTTNAQFTASTQIDYSDSPGSLQLLGN